MIKVLIAVADQGLAQQIQSAVLEMGDSEVIGIAATTRELTELVTGLDPDVVLVHEELGPEPVLTLVRDLGIRRPATAFLLVANDAGADLVTSAMEAGARGLLPLPLSFDQVETRTKAAGGWSQHMRRIMGAAQRTDEDERGGGRIVGFAGAKGGVGTTTIVTHLALDMARSVTNVRICLVDLDLEKGDIPGLIEVRHRIGIADLAKVADDLSPGTVADAVTRHDSGIDLLLAPVDIREVEAVTPPRLRQVLSALRRSYDVIIVDLGSHPTPAQATAVELADEIVLVVTPDVAAMRGMRRTINAWESLSVCKESDIRVLINRASKEVTVSPDTVRQLTRANVVPVALQAAYRRLEPSLNSRSPLSVRHPRWWSDLRRAGREIELIPRPAAARAGTGPPAPLVSPPMAAQDTSRAGRRARRRAAVTAAGRRGDSGQIAVETVGMLPVLALVVACLWQLVAVGVNVVMQGHAADAASRAASLGRPVQQAAADALPGTFANHVTATRSGDQVTVTLRVTGTLGGVPGLPQTVRSTRTVVPEP